MSEDASRQPISEFNPESNSYSMRQAKDDLIAMVTAPVFQSSEVNTIMGRLLENQDGLRMLFFVSREPDFKDLSEEIKGRILPIVRVFRQSTFELPNDVYIWANMAQFIISTLKK